MKRRIGRVTIWKLAVFCASFLCLIVSIIKLVTLTNNPVVYDKEYSYIGIEGDVTIKFYDEELCIINIDGEKISSVVSMDNDRIYLSFNDIKLYSNDIGELKLITRNEGDNFIILKSKEVKRIFGVNIVALLVSVGSVLFVGFLLKDEIFNEKNENPEEKKS